MRQAFFTISGRDYMDGFIFKTLPCIRGTLEVLTPNIYREYQPRLGNQ